MPFSLGPPDFFILPPPLRGLPCLPTGLPAGLSYRRKPVSSFPWSLDPGLRRGDERTAKFGLRVPRLLSLITASILFLNNNPILASAPPNPPTLSSPINNPNWQDAQALSSGTITFTWANNGDPENDPLWFYFYLIKWNTGTQTWETQATRYVQANTQTTQALTEGYYAWQIAAVDTSQQSSPWYRWAPNWSLVRVKSAGTPTATERIMMTAHSADSGFPSASQMAGLRNFIENSTPVRGWLASWKNNSGSDLKDEVNEFVQLPAKADYSNTKNGYLSAGFTKTSGIVITTHINKKSNPTNEPLNWASTAANWNIVYNNWNQVGQMAFEAGIDGVGIDGETYRLQFPWEYNILETYYPDCDGNCDATPVPPYSNCNNVPACEKAFWVDKVREHAKNITEKLVEGYGPNMKIFFRQGLSTVRNQFECGRGENLDVPGANRRELVPAFYNGVLDAIRTSVNPDMRYLTFIDYGYFFGWDEEPAKPSDFDVLYNVFKPINQSDSPACVIRPRTPDFQDGCYLPNANDCGYAVTHSQYIDPINISTFKSNQVRMGFFLHLDIKDMVNGVSVLNDDGTNWSNVTGTGNKLSNTQCQDIQSAGGTVTYDCNSWLPIPVKNWVLTAFDPKYNAISVFLWFNTKKDGTGVTAKLVVPDGINQDYLDRLNEAYDLYK